MNSCFSSGFWEGTWNNEALRGKTIIWRFHDFPVSASIAADIQEFIPVYFHARKKLNYLRLFILSPWIQPSLHPVRVERTIWNVWCLERRQFGWHPAHCTPVWMGCHDGFKSHYSRQMTTAGTPFKTSETTSPYHVWCIRNGNQRFCWLHCPSPLFWNDEFPCMQNWSWNVFNFSLIAVGAQKSTKREVMVRSAIRL